MNIELTTIIVSIIGLFSAASVALIKFGGDYILKKIELKTKEDHDKHLKVNLAQLQQDINNHSKIDEICEAIKQEIGANKVNVWMFHNGGYYYTGSPIQRMSMVAGVSDTPEEDIKIKFTNLPIGIFARNLSKLSESDYTHEKNELMYQDPLAIINLQNNVFSSALFKIISSDKQDWVGVLGLGWSEHKTLDEQKVEYVKSKLHDITILLTPKLIIRE